MPKFPRTFTVVFWNILLDNRVLPQAKRYKSAAKALLTLEKSLDVVCLSEVEDAADHGVLGKKIARLTNNQPGSWRKHFPDGYEHIGMFGSHVNNVNYIQLDNYSTAALTKIGPVSVAGIHLLYRIPNMSVQKREVEVILKKLAGEEKAIIMGDFNSLPWQPARQLITSYGYESAFKVLGKKQPITSPQHEYRAFLLSRLQRTIVRKGFAVDDIYIKGLTVKEAGTFKGESDHLGVWATLEISST